MSITIANLHPIYSKKSGNTINLPKLVIGSGGAYVVLSPLTAQERQYTEAIELANATTASMASNQAKLDAQ